VSGYEHFEPPSYTFITVVYPPTVLSAIGHFRPSENTNIIHHWSVRHSPDLATT